MSTRALEALKAKFGDAVVETHSQFGDDTAVVKAESWKEICRWLRDDPAMDFSLFIDLCGVDYLGSDVQSTLQGHRFEVVLHVYSLNKRHRLRLKARVGDLEGDGAALDSVTDVWVGCNWFERETYDLMGIKFKGHPDLRRILMYPEFEGHPLRKDYPAQLTQPLVPYRTEEEAGVTLAKQAPFGMDEGMPFGRRMFEVEEGAAIHPTVNELDANPKTREN